MFFSDTVRKLKGDTPFHEESRCCPKMVILAFMNTIV